MVVVAVVKLEDGEDELLKSIGEDEQVQTFPEIKEGSFLQHKDLQNNLWHDHKN